MQATKFLCISAVVLTLSSTARADGELLPSGATNQVSVTVRRETRPGMAVTQRAYVTWNGNQFAFVLPDGFRVDARDKTRVTLASTTAPACFLSFRVLPADVGTAWEVNASAAREIFLREHSGATITETLSLLAENHSGPAFDARLGAGAGATMSQVAFIPGAAGTLEFSLVSDAASFAFAQRQLAFVMLTFRSADAQGRFELPMLSDKL